MRNYTAERVERRAKKQAAKTLIVHIEPAWRERLCKRLFHSGVADDYIATTADMLPLACHELLKIAGEPHVLYVWRERGAYHIEVD